MKTFLILALLAIVATTATATLRGPVPQMLSQNPSLQLPQLIFPWMQQQQFPGQQQPFPPQLPYPQPQPFQPYPQPQPFPPQQPYPQPQPFPPQQPYPQPQPFPPQQPYPQPQQPILLEQGQQVPQQQQQQQILQLFLQQQLIPCRDILLQQRNVSPARYQQLQQQCCLQLWQIPEQSRCQAIHSVVHAIILHQLQQQQQQQQQQYPLVQGSIQQPQQQYPSGQVSFPQFPLQNPQGQVSVQPQQIPQFEEIRNLALQTLPALCNVFVPPYCSTTTAPFGSIGTN